MGGERDYERESRRKKHSWEVGNVLQMLQTPCTRPAQKVRMLVLQNNKKHIDKANKLS